MIELKEILERNGWAFHYENKDTWAECLSYAIFKGFDLKTGFEYEVNYHFDTRRIIILDNRTSSIIDRQRIVVDALSCDSAEKINLAFKLAGIEYELKVE